MLGWFVVINERLNDEMQIGFKCRKFSLGQSLGRPPEVKGNNIRINYMDICRAFM